MIVISWASVKAYLEPLSKDPLVDEKAAKALLVLIPLLGTTYVLVIVTPSHRTARVVFSYLQAVLLSTQGFTVAILYCFLNGETQRRWSSDSKAKRDSSLNTMRFQSDNNPDDLMRHHFRRFHRCFGVKDRRLKSLCERDPASAKCCEMVEGTTGGVEEAVVQKSMRHLWRRWSTRRTVHGSQRYSLSYRSSNCERDNTMKLYRSTRGNQNRSSCVSFTTTTTTNWHSNCNRCD
ncbi:diuretic hormone receptor [Trichonephila clavipes]|nr:diuretic hormone receptor [Trichonephila clavipes]